MHETLSQVLESHRGNLDSMHSELLRAFVHDFYACNQDHTSSTQLTSHTSNTATHFRPDISVEHFMLRNAGTKIRHEGR